MRASRLIALAAGNSGGGRARRLLRAWPVWERVAQKLWPAVSVPDVPYGLFRVHFKQHRGDGVELPEGTKVIAGDWLGELHFDNHAFIHALALDDRARIGSEKIAVLPMFRDDLRAMAKWVDAGMPQPIVAIVGITVLGRGAVRLGFTMRQRKGRVLPWLDKLFVDGLLIIYTPEGAGRMTRGKTVGDASQEAWMSTQELLRRYGESGATGSCSQS